MKLTSAGHHCRWTGRILILFCSLLLMKLQLNAQEPNSIISGKVSLGTGITNLSGTSVQMKGANTFVITDSAGSFRMAVSPNAILVFSHVGYKSLEVKLYKQKVVNVTLEPSDNSLEQVVVVGYGKQRQRSITGAISKVNAAELQDIPAAEIGQKLYGKATGLQLNQVSGRPGQGITFRLRGAASLSGSNAPLFVVDGQPVGDINLINPDEIESFTVLKDAAATALYGSRASNGVIIVTTKTANAGRTTVGFSAYQGWQKVPQRGRPDMMNAREFATFMKAMIEDKLKYKDYDLTKKPPSVFPEYINPEEYGKGTDWYDEVLRTAPMQNLSLNVSSGAEKSSANITATYFKQDGVMLNTGMERFSFRANTEFRPLDRLKFGLNIAPTYQRNHNITDGTTDGNRQIISLASMASPLVPVRDVNGNYNVKASTGGMLAMPNPVQQLMEMDINQRTFRTLGNAYADLEVIDGLRARTTLSADIGNQETTVFRPSTWAAFGSTPPNNNISYANFSQNYISWLSEQQLSYNFKLRKHSFDVMGGYSYQYYKKSYRSLSASSLPTDLIKLANVPGSIISGGDNRTEWALISWLGRVNYEFDGKYFVGFNIRRDGSSRLSKEKRWGLFPSLSAGWVISDENFFPKNKAVNFLKLRASYGEQGANGTSNDYPYLSTASVVPYTFDGNKVSYGVALTQLGNQDLSWEGTRQLDIGVDANLLNNRLTFSYDYFLKFTDGMLYNIALPFYTGYTSVTINVGKFKIWGHEFGLTSRNLTGPLSWNTGFNLTLVDNKVLDLYNKVPLGGTNRHGDYNRTEVGRRIGELYGYVFEGVYTQEEINNPKVAKVKNESAVGTAKMKDVDGSGFIDGNDRTFLGNPNARVIFGLTNDFRYRNWDLTIVASGQAGNSIMNNNKQNTQNIDGVFNVEKRLANFWRSPEHPGSGDVPRTSKSNSTELFRVANSTWVSRGDYLTIRNITLGYTFTNTHFRYFKSARLYGAVNQAFVFTGYKGQNPEVNDYRESSTQIGTDNGSYPIPRTFLIGVNVQF
ncbi:TonB-dependent receptor [Pseudoflavitalea sp. G-6-1-2]|uniref:SusC/RagA family TonB-linked outer membrane protein n=1 Tax=Pseudoflavitalea sp. G-6-1-2 TaxID=2728841 RepID=UPI00146DC58F|nr:TonB-dependent receptor [Pseudoflavitalea sp. G-6-1-2]NML21742.1 TonB-dependent receptor [Pseudoflavitalea sp. G-6-1-2]